MEKADLLNQLHIDRSQASPSSRAPLWVALGVVAVLVLAVIIWLSFAGNKPVVVKTTIARSLAKSTANNSVLDASGYVTARRQATVSAKITGKVVEVTIEEGQRVEAGQVLARLDAIDAQAQLNLAQAQLDAAHSLLTELTVQTAQARRELKRQQELTERKLTSTQALEQTRTALDSLDARFVSQQRQVSVAEKNLKIAQVNLDNTVVRAPFAGVIIAKAAQEGEIISPMSAGGGFTRTGIGTIVDMDSLEVEVDVNESYIGRVQPGQPVEATLNAYPDWKIPGAVIAIIPTADRSKATVKVRIALKQKDLRIVPDMGVRVAFMSDKEDATQSPVPQGVLIPATAIVQEREIAIAFVVVNEKLERRAVRVGQSYGDDRQILAGIHEGEQVVLTPAATLKEGDRVSLSQTN